MYARLCIEHSNYEHKQITQILSRFLDFKEFLMALDVTSCTSEREKLEWAFRLYDVDDSGSINLKEITTIMETLEQVGLPLIALN